MISRICLECNRGNIIVMLSSPLIDVVMSNNIRRLWRKRILGGGMIELVSLLAWRGLHGVKPQGIT